MYLSDDAVLSLGLKFVGYSKPQQQRVQNETRIERFRKHYGSSPTDIADMWKDLCTNEEIPVDCQLREKEKSEKGFKRFLAAHFFLWTYPKNATMGSQRFGKCEKFMKGKDLWKWVGKIAALKAIKIKWPDRFDDPDSEIFIITVDGTDCRIWEPKHPTLSVDKSYYSHKFESAALRYELAISVQGSKLVWMNGPFRAGTADKNIFANHGLKDKIPEGKRGIADGGYSGHPGQLALPNSKDGVRLKNFKSRARLRHETFNGRIKKFNILTEVFRHGIEKHQYAFQAVCVIAQYQMDIGSQLYSV